MTLLTFCFTAWTIGSMTPLATFGEAAGIGRMRYAIALMLTLTAAAILGIIALDRPGAVTEALVILGAGLLGHLHGMAATARAAAAGHGMALAAGCVAMPAVLPVLAFLKGRPGRPLVGRSLVDGRVGVLPLVASAVLALALMATAAQSLVRHLLSEQMVAAMRAAGGQAFHDGRTLTMQAQGGEAALALHSPRGRAEACRTLEPLFALGMNVRIEPEGAPEAALLVSGESCKGQ